MSRLRKLWPKNLLGQTLALLLVALFAAQIVSALILRSESRTIFEGAYDRFIVERATPMIGLMLASSPDARGDLAETMTSRRVKVWITPVASIRGVPDEDELADDIEDRVEDELDIDFHDRIRVLRVYDDDPPEAGLSRRVPAAMLEAPRRAHRFPLLITARVSDDQWMNIAMQARPPLRLVGPPAWFSFSVAAVLISIIVIFAMRRITKPLRQLSDASARLGRGETVPPIVEAGPADVREAIRAFNDMQEKQRRFVDDRTRMLAAISHDLRTPMTSLRLRAEMIDDPDTRDKMIATLDEMQRMTEATLAFARDDALDEATRPTDIGAMLEAIADDLGALGHEVAVETSDRVVYPCRPSALRRALGNLIENAATYGERARVSLHDGDGLVIEIDDDGPGIPGDQQASVFEPFVRLENSRNRETGGVGLGLAITRDIVLAHGGDIELANRDEGGLRVRVLLPDV